MIEMLSLIKDIIKIAFYFERDGNKTYKLIYDPFAYEYFQEHNIDFKKELLELLIRTKFRTPNLKKVIESLDFNKKISFNYINRKIEYI